MAFCSLSKQERTDLAAKIKHEIENDLKINPGSDFSFIASAGGQEIHGQALLKRQDKPR